MDANLREMVLSLRVGELRSVLDFANGNQRGRKVELQVRVLELVDSNPPAPIKEKIKQLFHLLRISKVGNVANPSNMSVTAESSGNNTLIGNVGMPSLKPAPIWKLSEVDSGGKPRHYPNVKMTDTPFFDEVGMLIPVTDLPCQSESLQQEVRYSLAVSLAQSREILSSGKKIKVKTQTGLIAIKCRFSTQIQLRFMKLDSSKEQEDAFPPNLQVFVNEFKIQLPDFAKSNHIGVPPNRLSKPVDITAKVNGGGQASIIQVKWTEQSKEEPSFGMLVRIAKRLTPDELFGRLMSKDIQPPEVTKELIKKMTSVDEYDDDVCAPLSIRVSLVCPLGGSRISFPCRASSCKHFQCFDAKSFVMLNALKPTFICPICGKHLKFGDLVIDGYFMDVIKKIPDGAENLIEILPDGTWLQPAPRSKPTMTSVQPPSKRLKVSRNIQFSDSNKSDLCKDASAGKNKDAETEFPSTQSGSVKQGNLPQLIDITDSSDDEHIL